MAARAIWKAEVCLGHVRVPVKLYSAVQDTKVHFRLLHAADLAPVAQLMIDPVSERVVPREEIQKGLEVERGVFVIVTDEDRQSLEPAPSREIVVEQLLEPSRLDIRWYERPYYLGPDGSDETYFALAEVLEQRKRVAIARWVMRKKHYRGALRGKDGFLMLETLRHAEQRVELERVTPPADRVPDSRERALAEQLVGMLEGEFDPAAYRDEYQARVLELIEAKARGRVVRFPKRPAAAAEPSLLDSLEASLRGREASGAG